jgi:hypothetical protein
MPASTTVEKIVNLSVKTSDDLNVSEIFILIISYEWAKDGSTTILCLGSVGRFLYQTTFLVLNLIQQNIEA